MKKNILLMIAIMIAGVLAEAQHFMKKSGNDPVAAIFVSNVGTETSQNQIMMDKIQNETEELLYTSFAPLFDLASLIKEKLQIKKTESQTSCDGVKRELNCY